MWSLFSSHKKSRRSQKSASLQRSALQKSGVRHLALEPLERRELLTALYWVGGTGTWNTSSASWSATPGGNATQAWQAGCDAYFTHTSDVVTLGAAVNANSIQLSAGTLKMGAAGSLNSSATMTANGGVFDLNGKNVTLKGLNSTSVSSTAVVANNLAASNATLTLDGDAMFSEYYGALKDYSGSSGGTLGLTITNTAANPTGGNNFFLYKSGSNYSGATNVLPGNSSTALINAAANALSPNSSITVGTKCNLDLDNNNAQIAGLEGTGIVYNWFSGTNTATLTINNAANKTFSGSIRDYVSTSKVALVKAGAGMLTLSGNNTFSGATTVTAGTLQAGSGTAFPAASIFAVNGGTVDLNGNNVTTGGLGSNSPSTGVVANNLAGTNATLTLAGINRYDHYYGSLKDSTGSNGGTLALTITTTAINPASGYNLFLYSTANTYSGTTAIVPGTPYAAALVNGVTNGLSPNSSINVGARCVLYAQNAQIAGLEGTGKVYNWFNGATTGTLTINNAADSTFSGSLLDYGTAILALSKTGTGTLTLTGTNTYTGGTTISQGVVWLGDTTTNGSLSGNIVNNSLLVFLNATAQTYSGNISGSGEVGIENHGSAPLTLGGDNTYTGPTNIYGLANITGTLRNSAVTVHSGGVYGSGTIANSVEINSYAGVMGNLYYTPSILNTGDLTFDSSSMLRPIITGNTEGSGYDQVQVTGAVSIAASASLYPATVQNVAPGDVLTLIKNDGTDAIVGTFAGLSEWSTVNCGATNFHITYLYNAEAQTFGDGNDVALVAY